MVKMCAVNMYQYSLIDKSIKWYEPQMKERRQIEDAFM